MKKQKITISILAVMFLISAMSLFADEIDEKLKEDFGNQETVKIRFEVNKRLFSFEAGKFKLENIKKNREKIRSITDRIAPWAIMEHLEPAEVARIIVYMYHAEEAGARFNDAEDLIPLVARMDIPIKEFVFMVQYNREMKIAGIPEEIRNAYLGLAMRRGFDGVSILTGGRGLILARMAGLNMNKVGTLLLKNLPANGGGAAPGTLTAIVKNIIGKTAEEQNAQNIIKNLDETQKTAAKQENTPEGVKTIMGDAEKAASNIQKANTMKISGTSTADSRINNQPGMVPEITGKTSRGGWESLSQSVLISVVKRWLGTPYDFGNKTGKPGIDCSGFTYAVLTSDKIGIPEDQLRHGTVYQKEAGRAVSRSALLPGDLVFFSASPDKAKITHVGLMITPAIFSHSCSRGVIYDELSKKHWSSRFVIARRVFNNIVK